MSHFAKEEAGEHKEVEPKKKPAKKMKLSV